MCVDVLFEGFLHPSYVLLWGFFVYRDVTGVKKGFMKSCKCNRRIFQAFIKSFPTSEFVRGHTRALEFYHKGVAVYKNIELQKIVISVLLLMI